MEEFAPASITGDWWFHRGWADIGPDGNVYATHFTSSQSENDWEPKIYKHAPGLGTNYCVGGVPAIGEAATPLPWFAFMYGESLFKIQVVGEIAYILVELSTENYDPVLDDWTGDYGEGALHVRVALCRYPSTNRPDLDEASVMPAPRRRLRPCPEPLFTNRSSAR